MMQTYRQDRSLRTLWKYVLGLVVLLVATCSMIPIFLFIASFTASSLVSAIVIGGLFAGIWGWVQAYFYGWNFLLWRWATWSIVGGIIGTLFGIVVMETRLNISPPQSALEYFQWFPIYLTCISIGQWFILRQQVEKAWLWVGSNGLSGFIAIVLATTPLSATLIHTFISGSVCGDSGAAAKCLWVQIAAFLAIMVTISSALTGETLLYLFRINQPKEKRKVEDGTD